MIIICDKTEEMVMKETKLAAIFGGVFIGLSALECSLHPSGLQVEKVSQKINFDGQMVDGASYNKYRQCSPVEIKGTKVRTICVEWASEVSPLSNIIDAPAYATSRHCAKAEAFDWRGALVTASEKKCVGDGIGDIDTVKNGAQRELMDSLIP
jgi:hypothetical protein